MARDKAYIVSPHSNVRNFYKNAKGMSIHRVGKRKETLSPVFKNHRQRVDFKKATVKARKSLEQKIKANPWTGVGVDPRQTKLRVLRELNRQAQPARARMNFQGIRETRPKIYVQGHGSPGQLHMTDDSGQQASVAQVSGMLKGMGVPQQSKVRINSCYSGTSTEIQEPAARQAFQQHQSVQGLTGQPGQTLAGSIAHDLRTVAPTFPNIQVGGYPGPTTQNPVGNLVDKQLNPVQGTGIRVRFGAAGSPQMLGVKRGQTRIDF